MIKKWFNRFVKYLKNKRNLKVMRENFKSSRDKIANLKDL